MSADVSELLKLAADLERASGRLGKDGARVVREEGEKVAQTMMANAPVLTGTLKGSVRVSPYGSGRSGSMSVVVGPTAADRYAFYQEFGTARMEPTPYAEPAARMAGGSFPAALETLAAESLALL